MGALHILDLMKRKLLDKEIVKLSSYVIRSINAIHSYASQYEDELMKKESRFSLNRLA
jgi:hypothetical protein